MLFNRIAGVLLNLIIYSPLLLLQSLLLVLQFVDQLITGQYRKAGAILLFSPIKILYMLAHSILHIVTSGWGIGLTGFFDFSLTRIQTYWIDFYNTDAQYFSALFSPNNIAFYEGGYISGLAHKLNLLFFASFYMEIYKNYHSSPHSPGVTLSANELYDLVDREYGQKAKDRLEIIPTEIESFLTELHSTLSDPADMTVPYARNCLQQIQTGFLNQTPIHDLKTSSTHHLSKTSFHTLCLVWTVIHEYHLPTEQTFQLKKLTATYLANMQRNLSANTHALDLGECSTGMINSFLGILKAIDPMKFTLQLSKTDSWTTIKTLLIERIDQRHYSMENTKNFAEYSAQNTFKITEPPPPTPQQKKDKQEFIKEQSKSLFYYGRFLNNTSQGRAITGLGELDEAGVDAATNEVLENWDYPEHRNTRSM